MTPEETPTIASPPPRRFKTIGELLEAPKKKWIIKQVLGVSDLALIYGPPSVGKSFLALEVAFHVAEGNDFFGFKVKAAGGVLYVAAEGAGGLPTRLLARQQVRELPENVHCYFLPEAVDLTNQDGITAILSVIEAIKKDYGVEVGLIVLDTLNRCFGNGDENSSEAMGKFIHSCDSLRKQTGATVLAIHHSGKNESRGARGHSSLKAAMDTEIQIKKSGKVYEAKITKQKDGPFGKFVAFKLKKVDLGEDEDGDPFSSCVVEIIEASSSPNKQEQCAKLIEENPDWTDAQVAEAVGCDRSLVNKVRNHNKGEPGFDFS